MKISSPRHLLRRDRLAALVAEFGGASKLATEAGTPKSHISALLAGDRGLGDALAAKLEKAAGKAPGWFDSPADAAMPFRDLLPLEALLVSYFREMPPERQQATLIEMRSPAVKVLPLPTAAPRVQPGLQRTASQKARSGHQHSRRKKGT